MSDTSDYISTQWNDIHHSRMQDWRVILLISGIVTALIAKDMSFEYTTGFLIVGLILSIIGFYISITHWIIFRSKMKKIRDCEKKLGFTDCDPMFNFRFKGGRFGVQQMIMVIYSLFISSFITSLLIHFTDYIHISLLLSGIIGSLVFIILCLMCLINKASVLTSFCGEKSDKIKFPQSVFNASIGDINKCLKFLENHPLKLISPELYKNESEWKDNNWKYKTENDILIDKKILLNKADNFQLSIANSQSKQDKHLHKNTFEIYISDNEIEVNIDNKPKIKSNGIILIPPNIPHFVKLYGLTYVFQVSINSNKISNDKLILE